MKLRESIKPISYLKSNASEIIRNINANGRTYIITQNGEAKAVVQNLKDYENTQDTLAMLKMLALSTKNIKKGNYKQAKNAFCDIKKKIETINNE